MMMAREQFNSDRRAEGKRVARMVDAALRACGTASFDASSTWRLLKKGDGRRSMSLAAQPSAPLWRELQAHSVTRAIKTHCGNSLDPLMKARTCARNDGVGSRAPARAQQC